MRIPMAKHLPALVTVLMMASIITWFGMHPKVVARFTSGVVSSKLLHLDGGGLRVNDFSVRPFEGMDLYGVTLAMPGASGGMTLVSADTVAVDFSFQEILGRVPRITKVLVSNPEVFSRAGKDTYQDSEASLPYIKIDHLTVENGYFEFSSADGRVQEKISRLDWLGSVSIGEVTDLKLWGCNVIWDTHSSNLTNLRGIAQIDSRGIEVSSLSGELNGNQVKVSGSRAWNSTLNLDVQAWNLSILEVEDLIDMNLGFEAHGDMDATFNTVGDSLIFDGSFSGELAGYDIPEIVGVASITEGAVYLSDLAGTINGAGFTGGGKFNTSDPLSVTFFLEGDVNQVDLSLGLVPGEEELPATSGWGHIRIDHTDIPLWTGVQGVLYDGFIETIPFDTCTVFVDAYADSIVFRSLDLIYKDLFATVAGASDSLEVFQGSVSVQSSNLTSLPAQWQWPYLLGAAQASGTVSGFLDDLSFQGQLMARSFSLEKLNAGFLSADLEIEDVLEDPIFTTTINGEDLFLDEAPLGRFRVSGVASSSFARVDTFSSVLGDTSLGFSFSAVLSDTMKHFKVPDFGVSLEGTDWLLQDPVTFSIGSGMFFLPHMTLVSQQGSLDANVDYLENESISGKMILNNFELGLLDPFVDNEKPLSGSLSAEIFVDGTPEAPRVSLDGSLKKVHFDLATIDSLAVAASFHANTLSIMDLELQTNFGHVYTKGTLTNYGSELKDFWIGAELDLDVSVSDADWAFMEQFELLALDRLAGKFAGEFNVGGKTDDPLIIGSLKSTPFHIHWLHMDELTSRIRVDSESLVLGGLKGHKDHLEFTGRIEIPMEFDFYSEPVIPLDGPFYMQLNIPPGSDFEPLSRATNAFISSSGTGWANVSIVGPLDHPSYQGKVVVEDAGFILVNLEEIYSETYLTGTFQDDVLTVNNIHGREGLRGEFNGDGTVVFKGLELETFDINLNLDRFLVASVPDMRALVKSSNARLSGVKVGVDSLLVVKFLGDLDIIEARYTGDFSESTGGVDPILPTDSPDWLADLHIHGAPRTARIKNRELELFMGGNLDLIRNQDGLLLRGTLDVNSGKLIVFNNSFDVQRGRLDFSQELGFDPRIDLSADTEYRRRSEHSSNSIIERIGVDVTGTLFKPIINFTSDRGYSEFAIQRMLLGLDPNSGTGTDINRLRNSGIAAGLNLIEREIAQEGDIVDIEIDQIQRESTAVGETSIDPLIGVGKYWYDFYFKVAQGIRQDDRDLLVEYQINNHLLLQSEIRRRIDENQGQPTYNLDLKYRFEY